MDGEVIVVILILIAIFAFFYALSTWLFVVPSYLRRIAEALERRNKDGKAD